LKKILIFGNSGSGKSTLAADISRSNVIAHLDLDSLAWLPTNSPERAPLSISSKEIHAFISKNNSWVIEGCYTDLLEIVCTNATEIIFLNLPIELCIKNAKNRPWEPHKYSSKEAQDDNLSMLIDWIEQYIKREDVFSYKSHIEFYNRFHGKKLMVTTNARNT